MAERSEEQVLRIRVHGRVQGVSFRYHTEQVARELGLRGWVRNLPGGAVEVHVEGAPRLVEQLLVWLREGPRLARVERLETEAAKAEPGLREFQVRH